MYARFNSDNWHEEVDHYGPDADILENTWWAGRRQSEITNQCCFEFKMACQNVGLENKHVWSRMQWKIGLAMKNWSGIVKLHSLLSRIWYSEYLEENPKFIKVCYTSTGSNAFRLMLKSWNDWVYYIIQNASLECFEFAKLPTRNS